MFSPTGVFESLLIALEAQLGSSRIFVTVCLYMKKCILLYDFWLAFSLNIFFSLQRHTHYDCHLHVGVPQIEINTQVFVSMSMSMCVCRHTSVSTTYLWQSVSPSVILFNRWSQKEFDHPWSPKLFQSKDVNASGVHESLNALKMYMKA